MKPNNTDPQRRRKQEAVRSAVTATAVMLVSGLGLLILGRAFHVTGLGAVILLVIALLDLGAILPVWFLLKTRIKEIEGGEEDAAAQY